VYTFYFLHMIFYFLALSHFVGTKLNLYFSETTVCVSHYHDVYFHYSLYVLPRRKNTSLWFLVLILF
jgi:hypothetical protein